MYTELLKYAEQYPIVVYFSFEHLKEGPLRRTSEHFASMALTMVSTLERSPEVSAGLRHLLQAKDCFVRAALVGTDA